MERAVSRPAWLVVVVLSSVLALIGSFRAIAQPGEPPPADAQVIAQGIDTLSGESMHWRIGSLTAAPASTAEFGTFGTGFAIGYHEPVILTERWSGESALLNEGQAQFHPAASTLRVSSTVATDVAYLEFDLTTDVPGPGATWNGEIFTAPAGTHNFQLTRDVMQPGETGSFDAVNDLPYLLFVSAGSLQVTDAQGTVTDLTAEMALGTHETITFTADAANGATWMIASIGSKVDVPPIPTSPTVTPAGTPATQGSLELNLFECPGGVDTMVDTSACTPAQIAFDVNLSPQGSTDPTKIISMLEDGTAAGGSTWRIEDMAPGTWVVQPTLVGPGFPSRFEVTGDVVPLGGIWGVPITSGEKSVLNVYLINESITVGTGGLTIQMFDCPVGTDPTVDASACVLAVDSPNVEVSRITQSEMLVYNSQSDAYTPEPGIFIFEEMPSGLFLMQVDESGIWTVENVVMGGDAYWDRGFWAVDVPADGSMSYVDIYHMLAGPPEPPVATGQLWITQLNCPSGTTDPINAPDCVPSSAPWQVIITSVSTGEPWTLSDNAYEVAPGSWAFDLPPGEYGIYVDKDDNWAVAHSSFATVTEGGQTEVVVYSWPLD